MPEFRRIDRIDQRGNITEHVVRMLDTTIGIRRASRTVCGTPIDLAQKPAHNWPCQRCARVCRAHGWSADE